MTETGHIVAAKAVLINEDVWQGLSGENKAALQVAAEEVRQRATKYVAGSEADETQQLRDLGMTVIGADEGLDLAAFRASVETRVNAEFGETYGDFYVQVAAIK